MENLLWDLSSTQLRRALQIREKIESLEQDLLALIQGKSAKKSRSKATQSSGPSNEPEEPQRKKRKMSAAAKAKIGAAQKARWAKFHAAKGK